MATEPGTERRRYRREYLANALGHQTLSPQPLPDRTYADRTHERRLSATPPPRRADAQRARTLQLASSRLAVLKLTHAFYTWRRSAADASVWRESAATQALLVQAQNLVRNRKKHHFSAWLGYMVSLRQEWIAEEHMLETVLLCALSAWIAVVERNRALRDGMMRLCMRRAVQLLGESFEQLAAHAEAGRERRELIVRAAGHFRSGAAAAAFYGWLSFLDAAHAAHEVTLRSVFASWKGWALRSGSIERRCYKLMKHWQLRYVAMAFRRWAEWMEVWKRCVVTMGLLQGRRLERDVAMMFDRWQLHTEGSVQATYALAKAVSAFKRAGLRKAWNSWNQLSRLQSTRRRKTAAAFARRQQYSGFHGWRDAVVIVQERRRKLIRAMAALARGAMVAAWHTWHAMVLQAMRRAGTLNGVLRSMRNHAMHRALASWSEAVQMTLATRSARQSKLARALFKFGAKSLAWAWHEWVCRSAQHRLLHNKLLIVVRRLSRLALSAAFQSWFDHWHRQRSAVAKIRKTIGRFQNRLLGVVWGAWVELVVTRSRLRRMLAQMEESTVETRLRGSFRHLRAVVAQAVRERQHHEAFLEEHAEALVLAKRRLTRRRTLRITLRDWFVVVAGLSSKRRIAGRAIRAMLQRGLSTAFSAWASCTLFEAQAAASRAVSDAQERIVLGLKDQIATMHSRDKRQACCVAALKRWLLFVEMQWEQRQNVTSNMHNLAFEMAVRAETVSY